MDAHGGAGGVSVCGVQLLLSLVIRAFAPPVAMGLVGGIFGLMATSQGLGYAFPYSLLCLGMRANDPKMELDLIPFLLSVLLYTGTCTTPVHPLPRTAGTPWRSRGAVRRSAELQFLGEDPSTAIDKLPKIGYLV